MTTNLPQAALPRPRPSAPKAAMPPGACDAHVHMLGDEFPLWDKRVEDPAPGSLDDWAKRLETHLDTLGCDRVVIVHSIVYGGDNSVTMAAVERLGDRARGIGLVTDDATDADLDAQVAGQFGHMPVCVHQHLHMEAAFGQARGQAFHAGPGENATMDVIQPNARHAPRDQGVQVRVGGIIGHKANATCPVAQP
ncbi:MAG: hypothetical protein AAFQ50_13735, partial [Pseudomonadota bacterium]